MMTEPPRCLPLAFSPWYQAFLADTTPAAACQAQAVVKLGGQMGCYAREAKASVAIDPRV